MSALDDLLAPSAETPWPDMFPERLSPSSLSTAVGCPEKWRRRYVLGEREPWGGAALVGLAVHRAAEETYRHKLETGDGVTLDTLREMTAQAFEDKTAEAEKDGIDWRDVKPADAKDQSVALASAYHPTTLTVQPVAVEEWVSCRIPGVGPELIGRVDVRTDRGVLDVKTTGRKQSQPTPDWHFKGMLYQRMTGLPVEWHVLTKTKTPGVFTPDTEPGLVLPVSDMVATIADRRVRAAVELLAGFLERYGLEEPWPTSAPLDTWRCDFCGHRSTCAWWAG